MKYIVTVTQSPGLPHTTVGTYEAQSGQDAIKQAKQEFTPEYSKPCWFATPCFEENKEFYQWGRG